MISGYLIFKSVRLDAGNFSVLKNILNFYIKRVRRILPGLIFVLFITNILCYFVLIPSQYTDYYNSFFSSIFFFSNWYFDSNNQIYGSENSLYKILLHTWSLSVEMQIYLFFPIILLISFKYNNKYLIHWLVFLFFISLCFSIVYSFPINYLI